MQIIPIDLHHFIQVKLKSRGDESLPLFQKNPRSISITSIKRVSRVSAVKKTGKTIEGTISTNEMDSHADTCVAGKNWSVLSYTDVVCEVTPFTDEYESIKEVPIVTACTVWTDQNTGKEYLLVGEQFLWFGTSLDHSLLNPNQIRANYLKVQDNPFEADSGISAVTNHNDDVFIPFDATGTIISFESRVPTEEEKQSLPIIHLTADHWDPENVTLSKVSRSIEENEMRTIGSLTSGLSKRDIEALGSADSIYRNAELQYFVDCMISSVKVACATRDDVDKQEELERKIGRVRSNERHSRVNAENLSRMWNVGLDTAHRTLRVTQQTGTRSATGPLHRMLRIDHLDLHRPRLPGMWFVDTLIAGVKSLTGKTVANVFTQGKYVAVYPLPSRQEAGHSIVDFTDEVGVPQFLMTDQAGEFTGENTEFVKHCRRMRIQLRHKEKGRYNQNHAAEREIGFLSERWRRRMTKKYVPRRLWDFGLVYEAEILSRLSRGRDGRTGYEEVFGQTPNIAEYVDFEFYDLVWWWDKADKMSSTEDPKRLARWLGISHRVGGDMCYWLVTASGKVISKSSVQHVIRDDFSNPSTKAKIDEFDTRLKERLDDRNFQIDLPAGMDSFRLPDVTLPEEIDNRDEKNIPSDQEYGDMLFGERPEDDDEDAIDKYIGMELIMDAGTDFERGARVVKRAKDDEGRPIGRAHSNPIMDSRSYEVEFADGTRDKVTANIIAENMYAQIDDHGNQHALLSEIQDHKKDGTALTEEDSWDYRGANKTRKQTTKGWQLLVAWKDGSSSWVKLKDIKDSNPIEVAEYAVANRIQDEPAFVWWVKHVLRRRNRIISKVKKKYWRTTHKYGVRVPKTWEEALDLDRQNGNNLWRDAINKEMSKAKVSWKVLDGISPEEARKGKVDELIGFQEIRNHLVFDVKMDFTRKARYCAGGHTTDAPDGITYSSVVSRDSVRLGFLAAALHDVDILSIDLENAYLNAPCAEKIWFEGTAECGDAKGKVCVMVRSLYGLKSSGFSWRQALADVIMSSNLGFQDTRADPNVYIRRTKRTDGYEYYEMLLVYTDDVLIISHQTDSIADEIDRHFKIKPESRHEPDRYLGADIGKVQTKGGHEVWSSSSKTYVQNAIKVVEKLLEDDGEGKKLRSPGKAKNPFPTGYRPELDISQELDAELISRYLQLIGMLRWAIELGRLDIHLEVSLLSQYQASPRLGHLDSLYHIFAYLKGHPNMGRIAYDPKHPRVDYSVFNETADWQPFYGDVEEELPPKMPEPLGHPVTIHAFVDANHAGNVVTRRSHSGIIIFVNNAPIIWFCKRQNTVESSTFGSELVSMRICRDLIVALRYKLRMFGLNLQGPAYTFCDNAGVVKNVSVPESVLHKRHNAINYHVVREAVAAKIMVVGKEDGDTNLADLFTKILTGERRNMLCGYIFR